MSHDISHDMQSPYAEHFRTLQSRHRDAMEAADIDHLLIPSGSLHVAFLDDYTYPFVVNPLFKYWVPVTNNPNSLLVITPGEKPKLAFYSPVDFWHKTHPVPEDFWTDHFDIHPVAKLDEAVSLLPADLSRTAWLGEPHPLTEEWGVGSVNPEGLINHLHYQRAWKTGYEIECLRQANRVAARAHMAAEAAFRNGASEFDIHMAYLEGGEHNEHQLPYGNIVALNEHAAILHYQYQSREAPSEHRSFLIDAGCVHNGYNSDITRTYASGKNEFAELIDRMHVLQKAICDEIAPGLDYAELHVGTHRKLADVLNEFGLAEGSSEALLADGVTRAFFPHGLGHFLGLQVHDVGGLQASASGGTIDRPADHPFLRLTRDIDVDQVFTIEPGLYFIPSLLDDLKSGSGGKLVNWDRVRAFMPFGGIRIEDNIHVTADGHDNLTREAFNAEGR
ncbi:MAG: Xaa-Pro dipeptidase [Gammaproteobacteria bacterium]|nr:Xaa-Pro dipeptidase [Gammaproteobacteria bacterium]